MFFGLVSLCICFALISRLGFFRLISCVFPFYLLCFNPSVLAVSFALNILFFIG